MIVKQHPDGNPSSQVFLLFDDDTHYELWTNGPEISGAGGVDSGGIDKVLSFGREGCEVVFETFLD